MSEEIEVCAQNWFHTTLLKLGQKVIEDCAFMSTHLYVFDCGCHRTYSINWPLSLAAEEKLEPCKKHKGLLRKNPFMRARK